MSKKILFLLRQAPYSSAHALEAIDSILVAGVFEQSVSVLFKDDGVWQLLDQQQGELLGTRTVSKVVRALPEYDVEALYVCSRSLRERNLSIGDLALQAKELSIEQQHSLISDQDMVVND